MSAAEAQVGAHATLTSDYVYRGLMMTGSDVALQLGIDYRHDRGWFAGAWASTIDTSTQAGKRDLEVNYYTGFYLQLSSPWSATLAVLRYSYPGATGSHQYDHNELLATVSWDDRWTLEVAYTDDLYGFHVTGRHWELRGDRPLGDAWLLGGGLGGNDLSDLGTSHYLHWDLGVSYLVSRFSFDFRYYDNQSPDAGLGRALAADTQFVISLTATF